MESKQNPYEDLLELFLLFLLLFFQESGPYIHNAVKGRVVPYSELVVCSMMMHCKAYGVHFCKASHVLFPAFMEGINISIAMLMLCTASLNLVRPFPGKHTYDHTI